MSSFASDLGSLTAAVNADPLDAFALRCLAFALEKIGETRAVEVALSSAVRAAREQGQLALAIAVAKELAAHRPQIAAAEIDELQVAYGRGSARVDVNYRAQPPRFPVLSERPRKPLRDLALDALLAAEAILAALPAGPLPRIPLFHGLGPAAFAELVELIAVQEYPAGTVVIEVGAPGNACYVIARGTVAISRPRQQTEVVSHLRSGAFFGEMALLTDSPRMARATCETPTLLLELPRSRLGRLAEKVPELATELASYTRDRLLDNLMHTSTLFASLEKAARLQLVQRFQPQRFEEGSALITEGEPGGHLYILLSGKVAVEKSAGETPLTVTHLRTGDVVGEISLLTRRPATATVRARTRTHALALSRDDFNAIVGLYPGVLTHLYQLAVEREKDLERLLAEKVIEADEVLI